MKNEKIKFESFLFNIDGLNDHNKLQYLKWAIFKGLILFYLETYKEQNGEQNACKIILLAYFSSYDSLNKAISVWYRTDISCRRLVPQIQNEVKIILEYFCFALCYTKFLTCWCIKQDKTPFFYFSKATILML